MNDERWVRRSHSMSPTVAGLTPSIVSHTVPDSKRRAFIVCIEINLSESGVYVTDGETHTEPVTRNMDTGYTARVRPHARASRRSKL